MRLESVWFWALGVCVPVTLCRSVSRGGISRANKALSRFLLPADCGVFLSFFDPCDLAKNQPHNNSSTGH